MRSRKVITTNKNTPMMPDRMFITAEAMRHFRNESHFITQRIKVSIKTIAKKTTNKPKMNVVEKK